MTHTTISVAARFWGLQQFAVEFRSSRAPAYLLPTEFNHLRPCQYSYHMDGGLFSQLRVISPRSNRIEYDSLWNCTAV